MWNKNLVFGLSPEAAAGLLLRLALGLLFFLAGLGKFAGPGGPVGAAQGIADMFQPTFLPRILVVPFAYLLPYVEISLGALLILGVFTLEAFAVAGVMLISLAMGMAVQGKHDVVAHNLNYVLITAVGLWFTSKDNRFALDTRFRKK
ncbi:MAG: DoxX family membrane protein [Candidatus Hydrogenedentes bacterium]|nr:DoxX family membrane protein [Candidatus Hydrogenedentota bacterium]